MWNHKKRWPPITIEEKPFLGQTATNDNHRVNAHDLGQEHKICSGPTGLNIFMSP